MVGEAGFDGFRKNSTVLDLIKPKDCNKTNVVSYHYYIW